MTSLRAIPRVMRTLVELLSIYSNLKPPVRRPSDLLQEARSVQRPSENRNDTKAAKRPRRLNETQLQELAEAYLAGDSTYQLARRYGIHRNTVGRHLERLGVATRVYRPRRH